MTSHTPAAADSELRQSAHKAMDAYLDAGGRDDFVIMSRSDWDKNVAARDRRLELEAVLDELKNLYIADDTIYRHFFDPVNLNAHIVAFTIEERIKQIEAALGSTDKEGADNEQIR